MQERHFIFDIDGTLINTEKAIIKFVRTAEAYEEME